MDHIVRSLADAWPVILIVCIVVAWVAYQVGRMQPK